MELIIKLGTKVNKYGNYVSYGKFLCPDCLEEVIRDLSNGKLNKSCGCKGKKSYKHGGKGTRLYNIWGLIKQRILNPNTKQYKDYGGRGITICNEWLEFIPFRDWALNNGYAEGLQINRIENDGNYEPNNCDFKTLKENSRNRRGQKVKNIEMANEIRSLWNTGNYTQRELAIKFGVSQPTISAIINNKKWN